MKLKCVKCKAAELEDREADLPADVKGDTVLVRMPALVCPRCGHATIHGSQMAEFMRLSADIYRRRNGLLTSDQIRTLRKNLRMSQDQFASHLGVGVASIKRWELGQIQDLAMDRHLRVMADPQAARDNYRNVTALTAEFAAEPIPFVVGPGGTTKWEPVTTSHYRIDELEWEKRLN
jgi:putative zinc finger/helix-turn-helix YgiT family protein